MVTSKGTADIAAELRRLGVADVDDSTLACALYSTDASLYRVVPQVVVRPRSVEEVLATVEACRLTGTPLTSRGAGTSIAGNAVGTGVVIDFTRHLNRVHEIDVDARTARVDPGTVHAVLQKAATPLGLRFGPDPSTHTRCTVGGMIGNNACGSRALAYGRTADNVAGLDVVTMAGEQLSVVAGGRTDSPTLDRLGDVVQGGLGVIRTEFGTFGRQVSGYSLEHLLPERGFDIATFLAGTEGTLATMTSATVRLVEDPPHRQVLVLGYASMAEAADDVPALLPFGPTACEGLDSRIVDVFRTHKGSVPELPRGQGWLFVEISGDEPGLVADTVQRASTASSAIASRVVTDPREQAVLWRIREEGAGLATRTLPGKALSGWEDAAVPPDRLGTYLREFDALLRENGLDGVPYGHFGDGCIHVRIDFPLDASGGKELFRSFLFDAATLVASHGGSFSGEHGDGRARSELLPLMYTAEAIDLFAQVKAVFDPDDLLNPGVLVRPRPVDADLRGPESSLDRLDGRLGLRLLHDAGDFGKAVHRCTGVGKCIADNAGSNGVMCPSFQA
ncbi:FAD-binding oxidoreductase, partial [Aeromicrobium sp.]|uniref:FAD-binding oxidoreductase n=1 Tax=Aeromicrobium sp. TaxID=1871063 RepID=UPI002FC901AD